MSTLERRETGEVKPIPLPWENVSTALSARGGLWPGLCMLIGGTGTGKTQFALQVALHAAKQGQPVWYLHLEMPPEMVTARLVGLQLSKPWSLIWEGLTTPDKHSSATTWWEGVQTRHPRELTQLLELPLEITRGRAGSWPYQDIEVVVNWLVEKYDRPPLVIIDYLQCLGSRREFGESSYERLSNAARAIENAVGRVGGTALVVSSSARDNNEVLQGRKRASLGELVKLGRGTGEIEYSADNLIVLLQDKPEGWKGATPLEVCFPKVRSGVSGSVPLMFDGFRGVHRELTEKEREDLHTARAAENKDNPAELKGSLPVVLPRLDGISVERAKELLPHAKRSTVASALQRVIDEAGSTDPDPFGQFSR